MLRGTPETCRPAVHAPFAALPDVTLLQHGSRPSRGSGHQAQSCNLGRQKGMDDENDRLGA